MEGSTGMQGFFYLNNRLCLKLRQKHSIFDEETCSKVDVQEPLAFALLEALLPAPSRSRLAKFKPLKS